MFSDYICLKVIFLKLKLKGKLRRVKQLFKSRKKIQISNQKISVFFHALHFEYKISFIFNE